MSSSRLPSCKDQIIRVGASTKHCGRCSSTKRIAALQRFAAARWSSVLKEARKTDEERHLTLALFTRSRFFFFVEPNIFSLPSTKILLSPPPRFQLRPLFPFQLICIGRICNVRTYLVTLGNGKSQKRKKKKTNRVFNAVNLQICVDDGPTVVRKDLCFVAEVMLH